MTKTTQLSIWVVLYLFVVWSGYSEFEKETSSGQPTALFLENYLFRAQKFLFNTSMLFTLYLFIVKAPFTSPMVVTRCRKMYTSYIVKYGIKLCTGYTLFTMLLFLGIPTIRGNSIPLSGELILQTAGLFVFVLSMYLLYVYILIHSGNQMLGVLSGFGINLLILMMYFTFSFDSGVTISTNIEINILTALSALLAMIYIALITYESKKRDYL